MTNPQDMNWDDEEVRTPCSTTEIDFYSYEYPEIKAAMDLCETCPIKTLCLEKALTTQEYWGVWGGASQANIRVALAVDINGEFKNYDEKIRCLACGPRSTKYLYIIEKKRNGTKIGCSSCGIQWITRKIISKAQNNW